MVAFPLVAISYPLELPGYTGRIIFIEAHLVSDYHRPQLRDLRHEGPGSRTRQPALHQGADGNHFRVAGSHAVPALQLPVNTYEQL